jgi:putative oxidoreductase
MQIVFLIARLIFGGYFVMNGFNHFANRKMMAGYSASKGVPTPELAVVGSGLLILLGGVSLLLAYQTIIGGAFIVLFLLTVTPKMHNFWTVTDPMARLGEQANFMKNLALLGAALAFIAYPHPWPLSLGG